MDQAFLLQKQLMEEVRTYVDDEAILNALSEVRREVFISSFYDRLDPEKLEWRRITPDDPSWLAKVYTDRPLTTSLDDRNCPDSSSSQPHLMALMIQSAHLHPGSSVLEVGTGTGYNAAILARIVGSKNLVTIDIQTALLDGARTHIERVVGPGVTVLHADGRNLPEQFANFDAILVTGSHDRVEPSWVRTLAPGGRIVLNWKRPFTKVMIEAEKTENGYLIGRVCPYGGDFMSLHDGAGVEKDHIPYHRLNALVAHLAFQSQMFQDVDFRFFLQINIPALHYCFYTNRKGERVYVVKEMKSGRIIHIFPHVIYGDASLWQEIESIHKHFLLLLKPARDSFSLRVHENGSMTFLYADGSFSVA